MSKETGSATIKPLDISDWKNAAGKAVITGGAGFLGSHLCDLLIRYGFQVTALDNLVTGRSANIEHLIGNPHFSFIESDAIEAIPLPTDAEYVFHMASPASVPDYQLYAEETALVNSIGTRNLLQFAQKSGAKFLFASTSEIYGNPRIHPQVETDWGNVNPNGVRACYDESKRMGEMFTMLYVRNNDVDARIVRIFNTYGPRMRKDDGRVVSNFINQALVGAPLTLYGDGEQTRSFCFVSDLVRGLGVAMISGESGEVYNLGNPGEYTMREIAQKVLDLTGSHSQVIHKELPQDDPIRRRPDITKAKQNLGWEPHIPLQNGLKKTIEWYKQEA